MGLDLGGHVEDVLHPITDPEALHVGELPLGIVLHEILGDIELRHRQFAREEMDFACVVGSPGADDKPSSRKTRQ